MDKSSLALGGTGSKPSPSPSSASVLIPSPLIPTMPRAPSTSVSSRASTPYSRPSSQTSSNVTAEIESYIGAIHRTPWPKTLSKDIKTSCRKDDGRFHCPEDDCDSTFTCKRPSDLLRHLASLTQHGDKYPYGPVYYCRASEENGTPCPFNNTQKSNAKEHVKTVHLKIKSVCTICQEEFKDSATRSRHVTAVHREPPPDDAAPTVSPSPSTSTPPPTAPRRNKRKNDEVEPSGSSSSYRTSKRSRAVSPHSRGPVPKLEPLEPVAFALETPLPLVDESLCHSFAASTLNDASHYPFTFTYAYPTVPEQGSSLDPNWNFDSGAISYTPIPPHNAEWKWSSLDATGFSPLVQSSTAPTAVFPIPPQATIYNEEPNFLEVQQTVDLFDALYETSYLSQPLYDPLFDPVDTHTAESTYGWDFNISSTLQQPLTCTPGEYLL